MGLISGRAAFALCGGWPDEACEGRDFRSFDAEAVADEFVKRQFQFHTGFGEAQHDAAGVAAFFADGSAGDFSFRYEGANAVDAFEFDSLLNGIAALQPIGTMQSRGGHKVFSG